MLKYDDPRWKTLRGGYRLSYDPTKSLRSLEQRGDSAEVWEELWNGLHHQGDVDEASYAAVPALVDIQRRTGSLGWNFFALVGTIEVERHRKNNPPVPEWLSDAYRTAWHELLPLALEQLNRRPDPLTLQSALAVAALSKGWLKMGALLLHLDKSELDELIEERLAWSELYDD